MSNTERILDGRVYLDCPRGIDDADCSKAQQVNNALAGCVV